MAKKFRESFAEMVDALRAHPKVKVIETIVRPPASGIAIKNAEKLIGRPLPDDLLEFYLDHDGIFLSWGLEGSEYRDTLEPFGWPDYGTPPGIINLLPIADAFSRGWVLDYTINWTSDDHEVIYGVEPDDIDDDEPRVHAVMIDFFAKFYHANMVFGPLDRPAYMLIADDHGAELMESNLSSFSTYLDNVLACWGTERMPLYKVSRYKHPEVIERPKSRMTLDEAVHDAQDD